MANRTTPKRGPRLNDRQRALDILACKLMLAYMETGPAERALKVWTVEYESGLSRDVLDSAGVTAWQAARFWRSTDPDLGLRLMRDRLAELTEVAA